MTPELALVSVAKFGGSVSLPIRLSEGSRSPSFSSAEFSHTTRFLIHDNDTIFPDRVAEAIDQLGMEPKRTAYRSPWQNGTAERWIGIIRRELLDHVIVIDESHLRRLLHEYVSDYNGERVHTRLRDSPVGRPTGRPPSATARVVVIPRVGGLHHRYAWREAA